MGAGAPGSALAELQLEIDELYANAGRGVALASFSVAGKVLQSAP